MVGVTVTPVGSAALTVTEHVSIRASPAPGGGVTVTVTATVGSWVVSGTARASIVAMRELGPAAVTETSSLRPLATSQTTLLPSGRSVLPSDIRTAAVSTWVCPTFRAAASGVRETDSRTGVFSPGTSTVPAAGRSSAPAAGVRAVHNVRTSSNDKNRLAKG